MHESGYTYIFFGGMGAFGMIFPGMGKGSWEFFFFLSFLRYNYCITILALWRRASFFS